MKKMILVFVVLMLAAFIGTANADVGNNPHSFELDMDCEGQIVHVTVPIKDSAAGQVSDGRIAIVRNYYIDFHDGNGWVLMFASGKGHETIFCTWTWDIDPFDHGMDIQFAPPK